MDFAALMSKELSKSKKPADSDKKFLKRSEIEAQRQETYRKEQEALAAEREARAATKRKREDDAAVEAAAREDKRRRLAEESRQRREEAEWEEDRARRKRLGLPERPRPGSENLAEEAVGEGEEDIPEDELLEKLRTLGEPVALFGEGHAARLRRYRKLTTVMTKGPIPTTLELVDEKDMKVPSTVPKDKEGRKWLFRQLASYFTMVLTAYERAMEGESRDTTASKNAYNAMVQTRENMKPVRPLQSLYASNSLTHLESSSANSKPATWTTRFSRPSSKLYRPSKSDATSTPTMATCASASARLRGPSA